MKRLTIAAAGAAAPDLLQSNFLLTALPEAECKALAPHLKQTEVKQQQILFDVRDIVTEIYFVIDAVVSLVIPLGTGETVESAMVGRDGVVGSGAALNGGVSLNQGHRTSRRIRFALSS